MKRVVTLAAALTLVALPALAHRGHSSLSVVVVDAATGNVTVTHRMAAHDVEPALRNIAPNAQRNLDDPAAMRALVAYGAPVFRIGNAAGQAVLTHKATELAGDDVRLTYVGKLTGPTTRVIIDSNLLDETHAGQENQVNVRRGKVTKTAVFRLGSAPKPISFE